MTEIAKPDAETIRAMNLFQRINEVRKQVEYVQKNKEVDTGKGKYKAVTHDEVTGTIRKSLVDFGIVCVPSLVASTVALLPPDKDGNPSKMIRYEATYDFTFTNVDTPTDHINVRMEAHALDNQDKAPGKAISYAKKYAVLKLFEIETGENEESSHADKGEFPLDIHIVALEGAVTMSLLQEAYLTAKKAAVEWPDAAALRTISKKTADLKAILEPKK